MDASILLVGDDRFRGSLLNLIEEIAHLSIEVATDPLEAMPLIQAQQPDLLIIQAGQLGSLDLCRQVKTQNRLAWIYCIMLDERPEISQMEQAQIAKFQAEALEIGSDACLVLPLPEEPTDHSGWQHYLVRSQVHAGLRQVHNYRELIRANDVLSAIALLDPLTELNNRRAFEWELPRQIQNARSREMPISVVMLDVDFFKSINDTYGHLVGDRALILLAARLRHNLRFYDTPFRYGGEEFVVVLSDTGAQEAEMIANRICQLIGAQPFAINETLDLRITISAGTATLNPDDDLKGVSLLQRADDCLLQAKLQGRNQVISSS
ncbi:MAG TPA: diguanylate cyclase [Trichocoleus sp.]|jgi:two-component system cell cycle response regulator